MTWTTEKLQTIPPVYRDFMTLLKPVIDSRRPEVVMRITGVHFGRLYGRLAELHDYEVQQVRQVADNLKRQGLVEEDQHGFFVPTAAGEELILALSGARRSIDEYVPPFPNFAESR